MVIVGTAMTGPAASRASSAAYHRAEGVNHQTLDNVMHQQINEKHDSHCLRPKERMT